MKIGIISDIHGNAEALREVIRRLKGIDRIVCLGDIIGYGADPGYCIGKVSQVAVSSLKGNHEGAILGELDLSYFNKDARHALIWTKDQLKDREFAYLNTLKRKIIISENVLGVHGSPRQPLWEYVLDKEIAEEIFIGFDFRIYFIGHSHIAGHFLYSRKDNFVHYYSAAFGDKIAIRPDYSYIINCGSVGQPRDQNPQASFGIFDTKALTVEIIRVDYPVSKTQAKIKKADLPHFLSERLALGI